MKILALETSVQPGSIALLDGSVTVYSSAFPTTGRTTQNFAVEMKEALTQTGWNPSQVDLFAVSQGPGSFTGLRIGVTAAKTFAFASDSQVLGVDTLEVLAYQTRGALQGELEVIMNAQRGQLFHARFQVDDAISRLSPTELIDVDQWLLQKGSAAVTGPGIEICGDRLDPEETVDQELWQPQASALGAFAYEQHESGTKQDFWNLVPNYFRKSAAEEKLEEQNG